jgi:hypothetical protein
VLGPLDHAPADSEQIRALQCLEAEVVVVKVAVVDDLAVEALGVGHHKLKHVLRH